MAPQPDVHRFSRNGLTTTTDGRVPLDGAGVGGYRALLKWATVVELDCVTDQIP